ncbi:MAG: hypothetical protein FWG98_08710 [Candidatus Cloacimonetes bacterium]|nr:hypothetical protein [Candidatus Cloacimonadota bacterium]
MSRKEIKQWVYFEEYQGGFQKESLHQLLETIEIYETLGWEFVSIKKAVPREHVSIVVEVILLFESTDRIENNPEIMALGERCIEERDDFESAVVFSKKKYGPKKIGFGIWLIPLIFAGSMWAASHYMGSTRSGLQEVYFITLSLICFSTIPLYPVFIISRLVTYKKRFAKWQAERKEWADSLYEKYTRTSNEFEPHKQAYSHEWQIRVIGIKSTLEEFRRNVQN